MKILVKYNDFSDYESINLICEKLKNNNAQGDYNLIIEYKNNIEAHTLADDFMMEIKPEHIRYLRELRKKCEDLDTKFKKIYLLGSINIYDDDELKISLEKANSSEEEEKNIIWPSKELYLYDGSKKILDSLLENDEIDYDEYEAKLKILQVEFGLLDFLEDEYYVN
jgi:hypothetical protein